MSERSERFLKHLFMSKNEDTYPFTSKQRGGEKKIPHRDRERHGMWLQNQMSKAWEISQQINEQRTAVSLPTKSGVYLEFFSSPNFELAIKSLENRRSGIRLMNVKTDEKDGQVTRKATVYIGLAE